MDVKRLPWVTGIMQDLGLQDSGADFWTAEDGRSIYLGQASVVIFSPVEGEPDFKTQHRYPAFPDVRWLLDIVDEHQQELVWRARELDPKFN